MLQFKDIATGKVTPAKPEKDLKQVVDRLETELGDVATKADATEGKMLETDEQVDLALGGITELYTELTETKATLTVTKEELATAQKLVDQANSQTKTLLKANSELIDNNESLTTALAEANKRLDETNVELKDAGDALIEMFMMIMMMQNNPS